MPWALCNRHWALVSQWRLVVQAALPYQVPRTRAGPGLPCGPEKTSSLET
jgi:hypothetical protein